MGKPGKIECGIHRTKIDCEKVTACMWESEVDDGLTGECDEKDHVAPHQNNEKHCETITVSTQCNSTTGCFWDGECESVSVLKHAKLKQIKQTTTTGSTKTETYFWVYLGLS